MADQGAENVVYTAEFIDGPLAGQVDTRVLIQGKHDARVSMMAAVEGVETLFWYDEEDVRDVQGRVHVRYRFDAGESDPFLPTGERE
ncbi:hypothetical protein E3O47_07880 [Cryobacterium sp. TMT2-17-1]|uniref:Uncharacterized protein n=1 Tax=Cryobacterium sandaracinum TaxID=1259247 RepID=A0ABY2JA59_9MICO|nr:MULTISPECIES: hypothetical protein [Cryobacterium]TFB57113.1 hypothetical protein E3N94_06585 [Cryobacterium sp. Sr3]TFB58662.1 hypothetical protein E3N86_13160 [Cryobacterium sp. Hz7]TFC28100.1 hypothetical protein E3O22_08745 [Cryobacterium sp. TMT2-18-2]TFC33238.1 hypothetical protein E3O28_14675 [Cryobacterium sp. TMT2-14]TFC34606.1 hypothetical protein E3O18_10860 [Cryobacterium sp. TMT2-42-4]